MSSYELFIGLRYTRARQRTRFISVISLISIVGIVLGMTVLITVLSVMNGFQEEIRTRILGVASHVQISGTGDKLAAWQPVAKQAMRNPKVEAAAPYVSAQGLLTYGSAVRGVFIRGIDPQLETQVEDVGNHMKRGSLAALAPGEFSIVLGIELARALGVTVGEKVVLVAPQGQVTPAGILPRLKQFTVVGIFGVDHYEYDSGLAFVNIEDAQKLYRFGDAVSGVRLKLKDLFQSGAVVRELAQQLGPRVLSQRLDHAERQFFPRGPDREADDVPDRIPDHRRRGIQYHLQPGDGGEGQAVRHRDPAHAGRGAGQHHQDFHGAGRDHRRRSVPRWDCSGVSRWR